jgi:hypothetical protein
MAKDRETGKAVLLKLQVRLAALQAEVREVEWLIIAAEKSLKPLSPAKLAALDKLNGNQITDTTESSDSPIT